MKKEVKAYMVACNSCSTIFSNTRGVSLFMDEGYLKEEMKTQGWKEENNSVHHCPECADFTAKTKYDWETISGKLDETKENAFDEFHQKAEGLHYLGLIDYAEFKSMIAKLKLNIIIQQIDKDYPSLGGGIFGCISFNGTLGYGLTKVPNGEIISTASEQGAKILLDQNPQLLQNLFKIETDATE